MKKLILFLVAVSCLGITQAQRVTKIYASNLGGSSVELNGDTLYYKGALFSVWLKLSFEFTNGDTPLDEGDTVIIGGRLTGTSFQDDDPYVIDGISYTGLLFRVPSGEIAADAIYKFDDNVSQSVSLGGVNTQTGKTDASAQSIYVSKYGNLKSVSPKAVDFYLIQDVSSISESAIAGVKVFPTLISDGLHLTNLKNTDVSIYSLVGQQMVSYSELTGNVLINVDQLANGIYFVKIQNGSAVRVEKIKIAR